MKGKPRLHLRFFTLCKSVSTDTDGALNLLGLMSVIRVATKGAKPRGNATFRAAIAVYAEDESASYDLRFTVTRPDGEESDIDRATFGWNGKKWIGLLTVPVHVSVATPGLYWFRVYADGKFFAKAPLEIIHSIQPPTA